MQPKLPELRDFAAHYTPGWCSQSPERVAAFFSPDGSLRVNDDPAAVGRNAITQVAQSFVTAFPDLSVMMDACYSGVVWSSTTGLSSAPIPGSAGLGAGSASAVLKPGGLGVTL
jgi:hypothetical protein